MEVYLGRQPILDRNWNVVGYELLFRSGEANSCEVTDDVAATSQVIVNAVLGVGLDRLLGGKQAYINFDRTLLLGDLSTLLTPDKVVIEILKSVPPEREVLSACQRIRQQGYKMALGDCTDDERTAAFAPFVDIMKVDFQRVSAPDQENIVRCYRKSNARKRTIRMIAGKVETEAEFHRALRLGYDCFQGFYFARPTVLRAGPIPASRIGSLRLVKQIQREELDLLALGELIRHDIAFSESLLRYVNSAAFHWANRIESIVQALAMLGSDEIRKWAWMACLSSMGRHMPALLMEQVLMRGRFCEAITRCANVAAGDCDPFLLGMFSLLDAILQRPLQGILDDLNIDRNVRKALLNTVDRPDDPLSLVLRIVRAYEVCDWQEADAAARMLHISPDILSTCYLESLQWVASAIAPDKAIGDASLSNAAVVSVSN